MDAIFEPYRIEHGFRGGVIRAYKRGKALCRRREFLELEASGLRTVSNSVRAGNLLQLPHVNLQRLLQCLYAFLKFLFLPLITVYADLFCSAPKPHTTTRPSVPYVPRRLESSSTAPTKRSQSFISCKDEQ